MPASLADLKLQRMKERFEAAASGLTQAQRDTGNTVTTLFESLNIDHKIIFCDNLAIVIARPTYTNLDTKAVRAAQVAIQIPYTKGAEWITATLHAALNPMTTGHHAARPETMEKFMVSLNGKLIK